MNIKSKEELVKELSKTKLAQTLDKKDFDKIAKNATVVMYKKGETIFKQGSFISQFAILVQGLCKITVENPMNEPGTIISIQKPISLVGVMSFSDEIYNATASAMCDSIVVFVQKDDFSNAMKTNVKFANEMFEQLCNYAKRFCRQIVDFGQKSIMSRVASSILYIAELVGDDFIDIPISRNDLAEYSGIATGSTIRLLSELEKAGIVILDKKTIRIKNKKELIRISQGEE